MTATTNYRVVRPIYQPVRTQAATVTAPANRYPAVPSSAPSNLTADQLALVHAGVQNVTPFTNPSELTPDQLNQLQSFQTMQNITANGGQLSAAQLQSLQAFYQAQAFANSPYVSGAAVAGPASGTFSDLVSSVPTWAWIAGGVALIFLLRGRK